MKIISSRDADWLIEDGFSFACFVYDSLYNKYDWTEVKQYHPIGADYKVILLENESFLLEPGETVPTVLKMAILLTGHFLNKEIQYE